MVDTEPTTQTLAAYVEVWWQAIGDFTALADTLTDEDWSRPTDLAGWDVKAVVSHVAHLESILGGGPHETAEIGEAPHLQRPQQQFTEIGVVTRRTTAPGEIVDQIRRYAAVRHEALLADPPTDPDAKAPGIFGAIGWSTGTLLRNRPLDVWMHEQDIRRAVGRPGGLDSPAADHTAAYLLESLGFVLARRAGAAPGTSVLALVEGSGPAAYAVRADGKGVPLPEPPTEPTVTLRTDRETFIRLAGGRGGVDPAAVAIDGDRELGERIVENLAVTP